MKDGAVAHAELLRKVSERLSKTSSTTDRLVITKRRVVLLCQLLVEQLSVQTESECVAALTAFIEHGPSETSHRAVTDAVAAAKAAGLSDQAGGVLFSPTRRLAVAKALESFAQAGSLGIARAIQFLPDLRRRLDISNQASVPGIRHRLNLVEQLLTNEGASEKDRARAAAAVLYVEETKDVVPDILGVVGMIDDDYALRSVLLDSADQHSSTLLHWSEIISSLWEDLPFLQGVDLHQYGSPVHVTWLDRASSYLAYVHVLSRKPEPLVLVQPSIACSPLHTIVTLIGLLVLEAITSSKSKALALRVGKTYEIESLYVKFEGIAESPTPGWLRLQTRDGTIFQPPELADRMVPVEVRRLSTYRELSSRLRQEDGDPMQRFFNWPEAIGPAAISRRLVIVASRSRALQILKGVKSNGIHLLDHGFVRFVAEAASEVETHGTLILVAPSLTSVRRILDIGVRVQAVMVDGYDRLSRGRHELSFVTNRPWAPPVIVWSTEGYYPTLPPAWLPSHTQLHASPAELMCILQLDDASNDAVHAAIWEVATGSTANTFIAPLLDGELAVIGALDRFITAINSLDILPLYWRYHMRSMSRKLQVLISSTPAEWSEIKRYAITWSAVVSKMRSSLRSRSLERIANINSIEAEVVSKISSISDPLNSRATAVDRYCVRQMRVDGNRKLVCVNVEQLRVATSTFRRMGVVGLEPALLEDVVVGSNCVVVGWAGAKFWRQLRAHSPRSVDVIGTEDECGRCLSAADKRRDYGERSILRAVCGFAPISNPFGCARDPNEASESMQLAEMAGSSAGATDCAMIRVYGRSEIKILELSCRVPFECGDEVGECESVNLRAGSRVILGSGESKWAQNDELAGALIDAVSLSHPDLVKAAREWRRGLHRMCHTLHLSVADMRRRLKESGVVREEQTIGGWLDLGRASPIAPKGSRAELEAIWPLVQSYVDLNLEEIVRACHDLRGLLAASGKALLRSEENLAAEAFVSEVNIDDVLERMRYDVHVYEVEAVTIGAVPRDMIGWWVPPAIAAQFEARARKSPNMSDPESRAVSSRDSVHLN